jgi:hypothetical protein
MGIVKRNCSACSASPTPVAPEAACAEIATDNAAKDASEEMNCMVSSLCWAKKKRKMIAIADRILLRG